IRCRDLGTARAAPAPMANNPKGAPTAARKMRRRMPACPMQEALKGLAPHAATGLARLPKPSPISGFGAGDISERLASSKPALSPCTAPWPRGGRTAAPAAPSGGAARTLQTDATRFLFRRLGRAAVEPFAAEICRGHPGMGLEGTIERA